MDVSNFPREHGMKIWLNGELVDKENAKLTVFDHGTLYGDGVFEGIRVYGQRIFECDAHMDRLFHSAQQIRLAIPYTRQELVSAMEKTIHANEIEDGYIRLVVTRGEGTLGLSPFRCAVPNVFVIVGQIALFPPEMYESGMAVIIAKTVRTSRKMLNPAIKSLNYLNNIMAKVEAVDAGVEEAIMLNDRREVCEGTGDNIFIVADGQLQTPPPDADILLGVTRGVVMKLAGELDIPLAEKVLLPADLYNADECFVTGTAAEVIGVTKIDDKVIGAGRVGPVTRRLQEAFHRFVRSKKA